MSSVDVRGGTTTTHHGSNKMSVPTLVALPVMIGFLYSILCVLRDYRLWWTRKRYRPAPPGFVSSSTAHVYKDNNHHENHKTDDEAYRNRSHRYRSSSMASMAQGHERAHEEWLRRTVPPNVPRAHITSLSFSSCGLHVFYHVGVARSLLDHAVQIDRVYASSGGIFAAIYYLIDGRRIISIEDLLQVLPTGDKQSNRSILGRLFGSLINDTEARGIDLARLCALRKFIAMVETDPYSYRKLNHRLFITLTKWPTVTDSMVASEWTSNRDLIECITAATDIPFVAGNGVHGHLWRGQRWIDGGLADLNPMEDEHTICVSTFYLEYEISSAYHIRRQQYPQDINIHYAHIDSKHAPGDRQHNMVYKRQMNRCIMPDIGQDFDQHGARNVMAPSYYRRMWEDGIEDARDFLKPRLRSTTT